MLVTKLIAEGLVLGLFLYLICAFGIRNGATGMVHLYDLKVQIRVIELGLTTAEKIRKQSVCFRSLCLPGYLIYVLICVYVFNGGVGHTKDWIILGTEDLRPYITAKDKEKKWITGTLGMALIAAALSGIMTLFLK